MVQWAEGATSSDGHGAPLAAGWPYIPRRPVHLWPVLQSCTQQLGCHRIKGTHRQREREHAARARHAASTREEAQTSTLVSSPCARLSISSLWVSASRRFDTAASSPSSRLSATSWSPATLACISSSSLSLDCVGGRAGREMVQVARQAVNPRLPAPCIHPPTHNLTNPALHQPIHTCSTMQCTMALGTVCVICWHTSRT